MNRPTLALITLIASTFLNACSSQSDHKQIQHESVTGASFWQDATIYFVMLDRFANGDPTNDQTYGRNKPSAFQRGIHGGDLRGLIQTLEEGYFNDLSVDAIWITPVVEQIHDQDVGWGATYAYHGYWAKDWTAIDAAFGSESDLRELIDKAHERGIKILLYVIINHTGPVTPSDEKWPDDWVRMTPECAWDSFENNVSCGLNNNLPDIRTEIDHDVSLPPFLIEKWRNEGRLDAELKELDAFFARTGLSRAPKHYIVKWLTDWVKEYGVDGFRVDTAKHVEPEIWSVLKEQAQYALEQWRSAHPQKMKHALPFFMVGEVMHFGVDGFKSTVAGSRLYDYGDKQVDFYQFGMDSLINMGFAHHAQLDYESLFSLYSQQLHDGPLQGVGIVNYVISHDDPEPYDPKRVRPFETANKLMLSPGAVQIYYGDEISRPINFSDPSDARLRLPFNWDSLTDTATQAILLHWQKLANFRKQNPALGLGRHRQLQTSPYLFSRTLEGHHPVLIALDWPKGKKQIDIYNMWADGTQLIDFYSGQQLEVKHGQITIDSEFSFVMLGKSE